ncbi:MAG: c-type cytochrome, partial [Acidimicrobiales bacterium]
DVSAPGIPSVLPLCTQQQTTGCVTLSAGQQDFSLNCAQCHQGVASGGMLSKGNVVPSLLNADSTQVAEAIRIGPKPMPVFGTGQLSDQQMSSIARYVEYLHHPANRGGLGISHFGPVAEGFVGIVGGFGLLLLLSRLIGTRG